MTPTEPSGFGFVDAPAEVTAKMYAALMREHLRLSFVAAETAAERDRARDTAVRLEQELAHVRGVDGLSTASGQAMVLRTQSPTDTPQGAQIGAGGLTEGIGGES